MPTTNGGGLLAGRVALVTGGSQGLGRGIAEAFVAEGAQVVICGRDPERGNSAALEIGAEFVPADVSVVADCRRVVEETVARHGRLDILVNNAGVFAVGPTPSFEERQWDAVFSTKAKGTFFCTAAAVEQMASQGSGRVITISAGSRPIGGAAAYSAANAAARQMMMCFAAEYGDRGVRFHQIEPGVHETPATAFLLDNPDARAMALSMIPAGRIGKPEDIAAAVVFLAGDASDYMQGANLIVDGGMWLQGPKAPAVRLAEAGR